MTKKILVLSGSPKKDGNTAILVEWFAEGARKKGAEVEVVQTAFLKYKAYGCTSCRACQKSDKYECVVDDEASQALKKMALADVIVMATPLYFMGPSAQIKHVIDRMFSLYKWDNSSGAMKTVLKGKKLALIASSYEPLGMDALEKPFKIIAEYTGMKFVSLLVPNAGVSGELKKRTEVKEKAIAFGEAVA